MTPYHSCALCCCIDFILGEGQGWGRPSTPVPYVATLISIWGGGGWHAPVLLSLMLQHLFHFGEEEGWGRPSTPVPYVAALISF